MGKYALPFDAAFVINLDKRPDKCDAFYQRAENAGLDTKQIERIPAVDGLLLACPDRWMPGAYGCWRSHERILEDCIRTGVNNYLVFEDDALFLGDFVESMQRLMQNVPSGWKQLYFGGQLLVDKKHPQISYNEFWDVPYNVNRTHCFAVSNVGYAELYHVVASNAYMNYNHFGKHIDHTLGLWHETNPGGVYVPKNAKWIVGQQGGYSDVSQREFPTRIW